MPRPQRPRRICRTPGILSFSPDGRAGCDSVVLLLDEFETLRLMDYEGRTHAECAQQMDISRTTVTEIYESARRKLAACLVEGKQLVIAGGNYRLCRTGERCCAGACPAPDAGAAPKMRKERSIMRIAVPYENGTIFQHFGRTTQFKLYDVQDGRVVSSAVVDTMGRGHGALVSILHAYAVDTLLCGGIGEGAQFSLRDAGIRLYGGLNGSADEAVSALLGGTLPADTEIHCSGHHGAEGRHHCGDHGCGSGCAEHAET